MRNTVTLTCCALIFRVLQDKLDGKFDLGRIEDGS